MNQSCTSCQKEFEVSESERQFLDKLAPTIAGKKFPLPIPDLCPDCRLQIRTAHRNEQYLYHHKSAKSGKSIVTLYAPDTEYGKDFKIYEHDEWWKDDWDAASYGRDFDFTRPFFEQFHELLKEVPRVNLMQVNNENSPYTTGTGYCKNCHLINCSENDEDCYYGKLLQGCRDTMDSDYVYDSELCYDCFYVRKCYNCIGVSYSQNCMDCCFSENLKGCRNCFLCTNLSNKEFYFMNQPMSKEQYEEGVKKFLGSHTNWLKAKELFATERAKRIYKFANVLNCENSTGDFLMNCKNCADCFDVNDSEDCKFVTVGVNVKDLLDCSNMYLKPQLCYQTLGTIEVYHCLFCIYVFHSQELMYSQFCFNSNNLFGCVGLRRKQYCILNKQYTKEQYEELVPRIIQHMQKTGEFAKYFPPALSPFGYNESVSQEYFPLTREEALAKGFFWKEKDPKEYQPQTYVVPDNIHDVPESILRELLACELCGKNYQIIAQELRRLKDMQLPIPRNCPDCRHIERMKLRQPRKLWERACDKCGAEMKSVFGPENKEKVYCEKCYSGEVY